eukprot:1363609-Rhodomonas_salina.1
MSALHEAHLMSNMIGECYQSRSLSRACIPPRAPSGSGTVRSQDRAQISSKDAWMEKMSVGLWN